jgi:hypothetical protein
MRQAKVMQAVAVKTSGVPRERAEGVGISPEGVGVSPEGVGESPEGVEVAWVEPATSWTTTQPRDRTGQPPVSDSNPQPRGHNSTL